MAVQLVEPGTPGEEVDQQTGGGRFDAHPMSIGPYRRSRNPSIPHQRQQIRDENRLLPADTTPHGVEAVDS